MSNTTAKNNANGLGSIRIRKRKRKDGTYYEFWEGRITTNYNPATGKQIQRTVAGASQAIVIQRMREILNPTEAAEIKPTVEVKSDIKPESQSLKEWSQLWVDGLVGVKSSSVFVYKRDLELCIIPSFGGMDLREIEKSDVKRWVKGLSDRGLSPKTIKDIHGVLHKMLEEAVEEKWIDINK